MARSAIWYVSPLWFVFTEHHFRALFVFFFPLLKNSYICIENGIEGSYGGNALSRCVFLQVCLRILNPDLISTPKVFPHFDWIHFWWWFSYIIMFLLVLGMRRSQQGGDYSCYWGFSNNQIRFPSHSHSPNRRMPKFFQFWCVLNPRLYFIFFFKINRVFCIKKIHFFFY